MGKFKVLSTRRLDPSLVEKAGQKGVDVLEQDAISVQPIVSPEIQERLAPWLEKRGPAHAVFTSANGVEAVRQNLRQMGVAPSPAWKVFCISGKTREAVVEAFPAADVLATAEYGAELARCILEQGGVEEVVFFCGNQRREELPTMLNEAGIAVHEITVYRTEETPFVVEEALDGVLFFSPSGVRSFFAANQLMKETVCFAIGRTTAEAIAAYTRNQIITSETTSVESVLDAVYHYTQTINCPK